MSGQRRPPRRYLEYGQWSAPLSTQADVDVVSGVPGCRCPAGDGDPLVTQRGGGGCVDSCEVSCAPDSGFVSGDGRTPGGDFPGWADRRESSDSVVVAWVGGSVVGVSDVPGGVHTGGEPVVQGSYHGSVSAMDWFVVRGGGGSRRIALCLRLPLPLV